MTAAPPAGGTDAPTRLAPFLWFDGAAEEAARFYAATFPDSRVDAVHRAPLDLPSGAAGGVLTVEFTVLGQAFVGMNGGPGHPFTDAVSFQVLTADQAETDHYWNALVDAGGGTAVACGWCRDRWGLSWQITPRALMAGIADPDRAAAGRVMEAMMAMTRIDIAAIERARRGAAA